MVEALLVLALIVVAMGIGFVVGHLLDDDNA